METKILDNRKYVAFADLSVGDLFIRPASDGFISIKTSDVGSYTNSFIFIDGFGSGESVSLCEEVIHVKLTKVEAKYC
jgi:hypothetical protein